MGKNVAIYKSQASALEKNADKDVKARLASPRPAAPWFPLPRPRFFTTHLYPRPGPA